MLYICCTEKENYTTMKKTSITLRQRLMPSGRTRLYLDIIRNGIRRNEALGLFLEPELTRADKQKNRETMRIAEEICAKKILDARNSRYGLDNTDDDVLFCEYFEATATSATRSDNTIQNWRLCLWHIRNYDPHADKLMLSDITSAWANGFARYLAELKSRRTKQKLMPSTIKLLLSALSACLNAAVRDHIISRDDVPVIRDAPKAVSSRERAYLTIDELRTMIDFACKAKHQAVKDAFVFSCLTGLRWVDIHKLQWSDVTEQSGFTRIVFRQQKTSQQEYLDITEQAAEILERQPRKSELVFSLPAISNVNYAINRWVHLAGIDKHITFHCARHTFAVMMLDLGTDIYTVSKLLGHTDVKTTQIYAKVLDKNKQAAVAKISDALKK